MSLRAMLWALNDAPVMDPTRKLVLLALADDAGDDGRNACPSIATVAHRACVDPKTVKRHLRALEDDGLVVRGDQSITERYRADRRPVVWDLDLSRGRDGDDPGRRRVPTRRPHRLANQHGPVAPAADVQDAGGTLASDPGVSDSPVTSGNARGDMVSPRAAGHGGTYGGTYGGTCMSYDPTDPTDPLTDDDDRLTPAITRPVDNRQDPLAAWPAVRQLADELAGALQRPLVWNLAPEQLDRLHTHLLRVGDTTAFVAAAVAQDQHQPQPGGTARAYVRCWSHLRAVPAVPTLPVPAARPGWCGECESDSSRFLELPDGTWRRCPTCNPAPARAAPF